jgi:hypothetical protein
MNFNSPHFLPLRIAEQQENINTQNRDCFDSSQDCFEFSLGVFFGIIIIFIFFKKIL